MWDSYFLSTSQRPCMCVGSPASEGTLSRAPCSQEQGQLPAWARGVSGRWDPLCLPLNWTCCHSQEQHPSWCCWQPLQVLRHFGLNVGAEPWVIRGLGWLCHEFPDLGLFLVRWEGYGSHPLEGPAHPDPDICTCRQGWWEERLPTFSPGAHRCLCRLILVSIPVSVTSERHQMTPFPH